MKHSTIAVLLAVLWATSLPLSWAPAAVAESAAARLLDPLPEQSEAPGFELEGPDGVTYRLADMRGKPVIVNFWATWCPPCRAEMPAMQRAWEQLEAQGVMMVAVNVGESKEEIGTFTEQVPVAFPLPMDTDMSVSQSWPMKGLPTTFIVDPDGRLVYQAQGEREWDDPAMLELILELRR
jgi:peroxiredoxin